MASTPLSRFIHVLQRGKRPEQFGIVGLAVFLFLMFYIWPETGPPVLLFAIAMVIAGLFALFGLAAFIAKFFAPKPFVTNPGLDFLSAQLGRAKRFMKQEAKLKTGLMADDPPSHEFQFKLIQDTARDLPQIDPDVADRVNDTDWETVPFQQWMDRLEALSAPTPKKVKPSEASAASVRISQAVGDTADTNGTVIHPLDPQHPRHGGPSVVDQLSEALGFGVRLMEHLYDMGSGAMLHMPMTSALDIDEWERAVTQLLRLHPIHRARFANPLPEKSMYELATSESQDHRRLRIRLAILDSIIVALGGPTQ